MKTFISLALASTLVLTSVTSPAQGGGGRKENMEAQKSAFITRRLDLTPQEARAFWPVYDQYSRELQDLRKKGREEMMNAKMDFDKLSDKELEKVIDDGITRRQAELDLVKKYVVQFKQVLPVRKVALLYKAEEDFKRELLKRIRDDRGDRGGRDRERE